MRRIATLERWGDFYRVVTTYERIPRPKSLRNWSPTLCERVYDSDEIFGELFFEDSTDNWSASTDIVDYCDNGFDNNLARRKRRVKEYALCNHWDYFATFTLSEGKQDRFDLARFYKSFNDWVSNYNKKFGCKLVYLLIPEQHKNGAWHAHGLLSGLAPASLCENEYGYLDLPYYRKRFGFISLSPIKDHFACANYITKYITKDCERCNLGRGQNGYLVSRGLNLSERLDDVLIPESFSSSWSNEWCGITFGQTTRTPAEMLRMMSRGENPLLSVPEPDSPADMLRSIQEWEKQYTQMYLKPLVYKMNYKGKKE